MRFTKIKSIKLTFRNDVRDGLNSALAEGRLPLSKNLLRLIVRKGQNSELGIVDEKLSFLCRQLESTSDEIISQK